MDTKYLVSQWLDGITIGGHKIDESVEEKHTRRNPLHADSEFVLPKYPPGPQETYQLTKKGSSITGATKAAFMVMINNIQRLILTILTETRRPSTLCKSRKIT